VWVWVSPAQTEKEKECIKSPECVKPYLFHCCWSRTRERVSAAGSRGRDSNMKVLFPISSILRFQCCRCCCFIKLNHCVFHFCFSLTLPIQPLDVRRSLKLMMTWSCNNPFTLSLSLSLSLSSFSHFFHFKFIA